MGSLDDALTDARRTARDEGYAEGHDHGYKEGFGAAVADCRDGALILIEDKKAEYERAAASTPDGAAERDAVVAALDTLHTHMATKLAQNRLKRR